MEAAERQLAEIMPHLSDEERAEIEATGTRLARLTIGPRGTVRRGLSVG
jgi:hypothetical protein